MLSSLLIFPLFEVPGFSLEARNLDLQITMKANQSHNITQDIDAGKVANLNFTVDKQPSHGKVITYKHELTYRPEINYTGPDFFTFKAVGTNTSSQSINHYVGRASITVDPPNSELVINAPLEFRAGLAFGISLGVVFLIFAIAYFIIRKIRMRELKPVKPKFWDIIRDDNWYPSLAIFQFLIWTGIVLFAYFGISLTRLFGGFGGFIEIPNTLLIMMGISAAVPITGAAISNFQYGGATPPGVMPTKEVPSDQIRKKLPGFKTMLMENSKITLPRFQMFAWTWIGIIAYLGLLYLQVSKLGN